MNNNMSEKEKNKKTESSPQDIENTEKSQDSEITALTEISHADKDVFQREDNVIEKVSFSSDSAPVLYEEDGVYSTSLGFDIPSVEKEEKNDEKEVPKKEKIKRKVKYDRGSGVRSVAFTLMYVIIVLILAVVLAHYIITRANDAFAFVKDDTTVEVVIDDTNLSLDELADLLHSEGAIEYPGFFKIYVTLKRDGEFTLKKGTYSFSAANNYDVILSQLNPAPIRETISITIPEGYTTDDVIDIFVSKGIGTREGFVDAIQNAELNYWFLEPLEDLDMSERFYRLDGYLYPDTYYFYTTSSETAVLKKILNNFNKKFAVEYNRRAMELGLTVDQVMILASIIQSEAKYAADFEFVSAVLHNRLHSSSFVRFDCDATLQYYFRHIEGKRHPELTAEDLLVDSPYNTRRGNEFFTPGPICNPSLTAIKAALYPSERGFYYFISKSNGYNVYAATYAEHLKYVSMTPEQLLKVDQGLYGGDSEG